MVQRHFALAARGDGRMEHGVLACVFCHLSSSRHDHIRQNRLAAPDIQATIARVFVGILSAEPAVRERQLAAEDLRKTGKRALPDIHRAAGLLLQPDSFHALDLAVLNIHLAARDVHHAVEIRVLLNFRLAAADAEETRNICLVDIIVPLQLAVCHDDALQRRAL